MGEKFGLHLGAMSPPVEEQLQEQGLSLGDKAEFAEKMIFGIVSAWLHGILTDAPYRLAQQKFVKWVGKNAHPIEVEGGAPDA